MTEGDGAAKPSLGALDWLTLTFYFAGVGAIALTVSRKQARAQKEHGGSGESYFLAEKSVKWWAVAASLFASNIGAEHFVGLAGVAAYSGIAVGYYEWAASVCLVVLAYVFLPVYVSSGISTMPSWLEERYNAFCGRLLVALSLVLYVLTKISATLFAGELILSETFHINAWAAVLLLIAGTAIYTVAGGLAAVIYTEALQTLTLLTGGFAVLAVSMSRVGGWSGLAEDPVVGPALPDGFAHIFRPASDPEFPWTGFLTGYFVVSIWYWAADQVIVQRAIAAKDVQHGRAGCVAAGYLKLLPGFLMVLPGMAARKLMSEQGVLTTGSARHEYDRAFTWLVMECMPQSTKGLIISGMLSALMSSLSSVFNSCSTIVAFDVYRRWRVHATEREVVWVGRVTVVAVAGLSCLWLPLIPLLGDQLFLWIQKPPSYLAPPILALYLWGCLLECVAPRAASITLLFGVGVGSARFAVELATAAAPTWMSSPPAAVSAFATVNFLHFSALNFALSSMLLISLSLAMPGKAGRKDVSHMLWRADLYASLVSEAAGGMKQAASADEIELLALDAGQIHLGSIEEAGDDPGGDDLDEISLDGKEGERDDSPERGKDKGSVAKNLGPDFGIGSRRNAYAAWSVFIHVMTALLVVLLAAILVWLR